VARAELVCVQRDKAGGEGEGNVFERNRAEYPPKTRLECVAKPRQQVRSYRNDVRYEDESPYRVCSRFYAMDANIATRQSQLKMGTSSRASLLILRSTPRDRVMAAANPKSGAAKSQALKIAAILAATLISFGVQGAEIISGVPYISDGDTIVVGTTKIRLDGIDAPETDQVCLDANLKRWTCGVEARDRLSAHIERRSIDCEPSSSDAYHRTLAMCMIEDEDLNAWMVHEGWALAFVRYSKAYLADEEAARVAQRGLWSGAFIAPWDWRRRNKETVILGATSVPISAQAILLAPASADGAPSPDCIIKGNLNSKGERIYFRPGQLDYATVNMAKPGKRWFCSEDEAKAAGWRPAAR
jgi:endonuclease YncB( thermonuclease family)